ncbi:MAG: AAA family ATPase [Sulfobacillus sp.]
MHLKRIVLRGFKSFADATSLEVGPGLCVVVGPNGAGKSNIVDALRWVLGESRPQDLRSQRAEDLIFQGNGERRPAQAAEVELTFADETSQLGLPTSEVVVARRIERTGDSECRINGRPCRLRDVQQLLLGTGLAPSGYAFIGQGSIEDVISQGAHSRRLMLEEAAGASGYRQRRTQALAELAQADILVQDLAVDLDRLEGESARLRTEVERLDRWQRLRERILAEEIAWEGRRLRELERRQRLITERLESQRAERTGLKAAGARLEQVVDPLWQARQSIDLAALETDERLAQVEARLGRLGEQAQSRQQRLADLTARQQRAAEQVDALAAALTQGSAQRASDQSSLAQMVTLIEEVEALGGAGLPVLDPQRWEQLRTVAYQDHMPDVEEQGRWRVRLDELEAAQAAGGSRLEEIQTEAQARLAERQQLTREITQVERQLAQIDEAERTNWSAGRPLRAGARAVMEASDLGQLPGVLGPLGGLVQCEARFSTALGVALGGAYDNLVVSSEAAAQAAIGHLREHRLGRATFLPLDRLRPSPSATVLPAQSGYLGPLSAHLSYSPEVAPAVALILGRTQVAQTLEAALRLSRAEGQLSRWVTLTGDLLLPGGAIQGGETIERLPRHEVGQLQGRLQQLRLAAQKVDRRMEELLHARTDLQLALGEQRHELTAVRDRVSGLRLEAAMELGLRPALLAIDTDTYSRWRQAKEERGRLEERLVASDRQLTDLGERRQLATQELAQCQELIAELERAAGVEAHPSMESHHQSALLRQGRQVLRGLARNLELLERRGRERASRIEARLLRLEDSDVRLSEEGEQVVADLAACQRRLYTELGAKPGVSPGVPAGTLDDLATLRRQLSDLEPVNAGARPEAERVGALRQELTERRQDAMLSKERLLTLAAEADQQLDSHYKGALSDLQAHFQRVFAEMFPDGDGELMASPDGVDFTLTLPGKRRASLALLSGGERALVALCWLISLVELNPAPFLCLDEVEASLDEENIRRLLSYFDRHRERQVLMISHQRMTMEWADVLVGVTMDRPGESRLVEVRLEEAWRGDLGAV